MPAPLLIAAAGFGVSAVSKYFSSQSAEEERRRRFDERLRGIEEGRKADVAETSRVLNQQLLSRLSRAKQSGTRAALALGRKNEAVSFTAPIESEATNVFAGALERAITNINARARADKRGAEADFAGRPIPYNAGDLLGDIGETAGSFALEKYLLGSTPLEDETQPLNLNVGGGGGNSFMTQGLGARKTTGGNSWMKQGLGSGTKRKGLSFE